MISFNKDTNLFCINNADTTYAIKIDNGHVLHAWFGKACGDDDLTYLTRHREFGFAETMPEREKLSYNDYIPFEMPCDGLGDFRESALSVINAKGHNGIEPLYKSHRIYKGHQNSKDFHVYSKTEKPLKLPVKTKI